MEETNVHIILLGKFMEDQESENWKMLKYILGKWPVLLH
jgi:hypothetical protein